MIDVTVADGAIEAVDVGKNAVRLELDGWSAAAAGPALDRRVDRTLTGAVRGLEFAEAAVSIEDADGRWRLYDRRSGAVALDRGPTHVKVELPVVVYVAFEAPATLEPRATAGSPSPSPTRRR